MRLAYEQGNYQEALKYYDELPRDYNIFVIQYISQERNARSYRVEYSAQVEEDILVLKSMVYIHAIALALKNPSITIPSPPEKVVKKYLDKILMEINKIQSDDLKNTILLEILFDRKSKIYQMFDSDSSIGFFQNNNNDVLNKAFKMYNESHTITPQQKSILLDRKIVDQNYWNDTELQA